MPQPNLRLIWMCIACILALAATGCVSTGNTEDDCPGDSVLIDGQCVGVDENGNPK